MKVSLLNQRKQTCYLYIGFLVLAANLLLVSTSLAQLADARIAFMSNRSGNGEIYLMNPDGKRLRRLTRHPQYDSAPAWSPDGQKITFLLFRDEHRIQARGMILSDIYVMNTDGTNPINLTQSAKRMDSGATWSPDGKQIAFTSTEHFHANVWLMDADGGNPRNLTNHDAGDRSGGSGAPDWSPNGNQIAFSSLRDGNWEIYVMNADGANPINLTNHPAKDGRPDWSPDGNRIAFTSDRDGNLEIYVMNANGTNPINLTNHPDEDNHASWSPDGTRIAFDSLRDRDRDYNWEIYVMNADGTNPIRLTQNRDWDINPSWGPALTLSVSPTRHLATLWGKVKRSNTYSGR